MAQSGLRIIRYYKNKGISVHSQLAKFRNAGSIVIRLHYKGKSILFAGNAVGRHIGDPDTTLISTEKFMCTKKYP